MRFDMIVAMDSHFNLASQRIVSGLSDSQIVSMALEYMSDSDLSDTIHRFGLLPVRHYLHGQNIGRDDYKIKGYMRYISRYLELSQTTMDDDGLGSIHHMSSYDRDHLVSRILSRLI